MSRKKIITVRVTEEEEELLNELKSVIYNKGIIENNAMSSLVRWLAISRCEQVVAELDDMNMEE